MRAQGSLDLKELKTALLSVQAAAKVVRDTPDPLQGRAEKLRATAAKVDEAIDAVRQADTAEDELARYEAELAGRADVQLGALLYRRKIKPGAVTTNWAKSKGVHAGELSKAEFRGACIALGLKGMESREIDQVFDKYDEDGGGFMDADEAKEMIRGLQKIAEECEHDRFHKTMAAQQARRAAVKQAVSAMLAPETQDVSDGPGASPSEARAASPWRMMNRKARAPISHPSPAASAPHLV